VFVHSGTDSRGDRKLLFIQTLAGFAQWLDIFLIFSVPSFVWKADPAQIAMLASLFGIPSLFLGPVFGAFLDRNDPRRIMLIGALARTLFSFMIAAATSFDLFAALVLAKGLSNILYWPSSSVVVNMVVMKERRVGYFANLSMFDQLSKVATPLAAAAMAAIAPMQSLFLVSATATAVCALMVLRLSVDASGRTESKRTISGLVTDLLAGFKAFRALPRDLKVGIGFSICMSLTLAIYDPHLAAFLSARGFQSTAFSVVVSATAAGAIAGASIIRIVWKSASPGTLIRGGVFCFSVALFVTTYFASARPDVLSVGLLACIWFLNGLGYELFAIGSSVNIQNLCPQGLLGRINTSQRSLQLTAIVLGPVFGAWLIGQEGRNAPFVISSCIALFAVCAVGVWKPVAEATSPQSG
jgi:MFS family permease